MKRVHYLQHVPFETPGYLEELTGKYNCTVTFTRLWEKTDFPAPADIDLLIILGGPMNIYEHDRYPWLLPEKKFIADAIVSGIKILGICLGSQLLADMLGSTVSPNRCKEIGWYPVHLAREGMASRLLKDIPSTFIPFHWHGDTFPIPPGAIRIGSSDACDNQGFIFDNRIVALQFHCEMAPQNMKNLIEACRSELIIGEYVQTARVIEDDTELLMEPAQQIMEQLFRNILEV